MTALKRTITEKEKKGRKEGKERRREYSKRANFSFGTLFVQFIH